MCTDEYLVKHPCDIPWMLDENGACTVLIEDHINAHGPSRNIFMAYHAWASLICLAMSGHRLLIVWSDPMLRRQHQGVRLLVQPQVLRVVFQVYGTLAVALQGIDVRGYGGRLSFGVYIFLYGQSIWGLLLSVTWTFCLWYEAFGALEDASVRRRRASWLKLGAGTSLSVSYFVVQPLQVAIRPRNAALGVTNAIISLCAGVSSAVIITCITALVTADFIRSRRYLTAKQSSFGKRQLSVARGLSVRKISVAPPPQPSGPRESRLQISVTTLEALAAGSSVVPTHTSVHQLGKFTAFLWITVFASVALGQNNVRDALRCWAWNLPPDVQYWNSRSLILLCGAAALALAHMKTHNICVCPTTIEATQTDESARESRDMLAASSGPGFHGPGVHKPAYAGGPRLTSTRSVRDGPRTKPRMQRFASEKIHVREPWGAPIRPQPIPEA